METLRILSLLLFVHISTAYPAGRFDIIMKSSFKLFSYFSAEIEEAVARQTQTLYTQNPHFNETAVDSNEMFNFDVTTVDSDDTGK